MYGFELKNVIESKCVPCVNFSKCILKEYYEKQSENFKIETKDFKKLSNCLFFRKI